MIRLIKKISKYGVKQSFYRALHRLASGFSFHPRYLYRKYFFGYAVKKINGVKMFLDLKKDEGISKFLMIYGKREPLSVDHLLALGILKEGGVALDLGANIGYYALLESKLVGNNGLVYAVEPVLNNLRLLKKNIELNHMNNVNTYNLAMGREDKAQVEIYMRSKGNLSSLTPLSPEYGKIVATEQVKMRSVDTFVRQEIGRTPDFIRMDVEGYELEILEGMKETMREKPCLQIEFHPTLLNKEQKDRIYELLKGNYSSVTIIINPKPYPGRFIRMLNKKMGENFHGEGTIEKGDVKFLHELLFSSPRIFNTFIS